MNLVERYVQEVGRSLPGLRAGRWDRFLRVFEALLGAGAAVVFWRLWQSAPILGVDGRWLSAQPWAGDIRSGWLLGAAAILGMSLKVGFAAGLVVSVVQTGVRLFRLAFGWRQQGGQGGAS